MLATRSNDTVPAVGGRPRLTRSLTTQVPAGAWERGSAGHGAHDPRLFEWATVELDPAGLLDQWGHWPLIRRQITTDRITDRITGGLAFYRCAGPSPTPVAKLVRVAGTRWAPGRVAPARYARREPCAMAISA